MNLIKQMKEKIAKSGANKKEVLYFGADAKKRIRFLNDLDDGFTFKFHKDWNADIFELCTADEDGDGCEMCKDGISTEDQYFWSVWDYDTNTVKLLMFKAYGVTPIPAFIEMHENFGTMTDRDYTIKKVGKGQGSSFVITPLDKERFNNKKAKPFSKAKIQEIIEKAWAPSSSKATDDDDDDEEEETKTAKKKAPAKKKAKKKEPTVREKFEQADYETVKQIAIEIGMTKKEVRSLDEEELVEELFELYEEEDLLEMLEEADDYDDDED